MTIQAPICPKCGAEAIEMQSQWGVKHVCCDLWSYGGKPLVDKRTHGARIKAHESFDLLWRGGPLDRGTAYEQLARHLGITVEDTHMGRMTFETLRRVPEAVKAIWAGLPPRIERPTKVQRQLMSLRMPKCACGNTLSRARVADGITNCPACDPVNEGEHRECQTSRS